MRTLDTEDTIAPRRTPTEDAGDTRPPEAGPAEHPAYTVDGNRLTLLDAGPKRLEALLALIEGAQTSLRVLYYIFVDDHAGTAVRDGLMRAAKRGVQVSLLVDGLGSEHAQAHHFFDPMREAGISVCRFEPRWGRRYLLRNHQKLALADGETEAPRVIIGGFNVEDDYFATAPDKAWRDLGLLVEGPAAGRLTAYFDALADWAHTDGAPRRQLNRLLKRSSEAEGAARWLFGGPMRRLSPWARAVRHDMRHARRIDVIAAYFAPSPSMLRRMDRGSLRGQVRVIVPSKADHAIAVWAARFTFAGLLRKGVEVYEYQPTKLHTKLYVIDDTVYIGSANFDIRSLFLNLELMLRIEDRAFAAHVRGYFEGEVAKSERVTPELYKAHTSLWTRTKQAVAYFIMAVLDYNVSAGLNFGRRSGE